MLNQAIPDFRTINMRRSKLGSVQSHVTILNFTRRAKLFSSNLPYCGIDISSVIIWFTSTEDGDREHKCDVAGRHGSSALWVEISPQIPAGQDDIGSG